MQTGHSKEVTCPKKLNDEQPSLHWSAMHFLILIYIYDTLHYSLFTHWHTLAHLHNYK